MSIHENGYIVLKNVLIEDQLRCFDTNKQHNYNEIKNFIDTTFFDTIKRNVDFITKPTYTKFRYSNNNNSTDAATFHSDVYNYTGNKYQPIYTCLCYLDDTKMELIPGSHLYNRNGYSLESYNKKQIIDVKRGDILIFYSSIHHRGIGFNTTKDRRLLQVFEVFPDDDTYVKHKDTLMCVLSSKSNMIDVINKASYYMSKNETLQNLITQLHYFLMYNDVHYKLGLMDISPWEKTNRYITYEPGKRVSYNDMKGDEELNVNIICDNSIDTREHGRLYFYLYILYWIVTTLIIYLIYMKQTGTKSTTFIRPYQKHVSNIVTSAKKNIRRLF